MQIFPFMVIYGAWYMLDNMNCSATAHYQALREIQFVHIVRIWEWYERQLYIFYILYPPTIKKEI